MEEKYNERMKKAGTAEIKTETRKDRLLRKERKKNTKRRGANNGKIPGDGIEKFSLKNAPKEKQRF